MNLGRNTVSACIYMVLVIVVIMTRIWGVPYGREVGVGLLVVFLALEFGRAPPLQRNMGAALAVVGAVASLFGGDLIGVLIDGLDRAQIFIVMFFAVTWLREPAIASPSLRELRDVVIRQPAGRRYPLLWLSVHLLGSVLNLAAMSLLSGMVSEQKDRRLRRRLSMALMFGFTTASSWGPFYVSVAVILTAIPEVRWIEVAPLGVGMATCMLAVGWSYDRLVLRQPGQASRSAGAALPRITPSTVVRICAILSSLVILVMGIHELAGLPIPIALGVVCPPFAVAWAMVQAPVQTRWAGGGRPLMQRIFRGLPDLRNEAIAFVAASILGVGVATVLPPDVIGGYLREYDITGDAVVVVLIFGMVLASASGLHPVILVILIGEVLPPEVIGMPPAILALALLGVWGTSTMVSPFSATTLFMGRVIGVPSHIIAWRWTPPVVFLACSVVAAYVVVIRHLFYL